ncbi:protein kinase and PP2C-like domain-containing protein isoform X3 [Coffea eugenioides]|uniref:protein kinase and PP2C-like domain-containing protein isoform X3 n=1 Tax=Coffea eugenioides TaxID=49369 RepID=UPI000F6070C4|nr:protein kinase and PP2C-like domain-containing protein isoform X3 [Coffea eugenioides]
MGLEIVEPNTCIRGCCHSQTIPLHLPPSSYSLSSPIARGAESVVYDAILDGKKLAVKKPILSTSEDIDKFHKQLQLLCKLDHPGIAKLVAAHARPPNYMFFFEFYECGNLAEKLHVDEWVPTFDQVIHIALDLAKSLKYLHSLGIVHRDVKPSNILLDRNLRPHLADFGLAEYLRDLKQVSIGNWKPSGKPTGGFHKRNMVGTLIYMAPEILTKDLQTEKSDVYSFGVSLNELLTGVVPYTDLRAEAQAHTVLEMNYTEQKLTAAVVSEGLRPVLASSKLGASASVLSLIERCWDADPEIVSWGSFATCGRRETMEDRHFLMPHLCDEKDIHAFGIFDGHRGAAAAEFSAGALPGFLQTLASMSSPSDALYEAFVKTDSAFREELDSRRKSKGVIKKDWHPGCTAVTALIVKNRLFVANAGDCRTMLCRSGHPYSLSRDHVASWSEERERVISAGGQVKWQIDTWRVGQAALQVTRSIGDDDLKPAVTAEPEITETILSAADEYIVRN